MHIDWSSLVAVAVVAAAAATTVVLLVAFAVVGFSRPQGQAGGTPPRLAIPVLCVVAAGSIVGYGLYLITA